MLELLAACGRYGLARAIAYGDRHHAGVKTDLDGGGIQRRM